MKSYHDAVHFLGQRMFGNYMSGGLRWEGISSSIISEIYEKPQKKVDKDIYAKFNRIKSDYYSKMKAKQ